MTVAHIEVQANSPCSALWSPADSPIPATLASSSIFNDVSVGQTIVLCRLPALPEGGRPRSAMVCPTKVNSIAASPRAVAKDLPTTPKRHRLFGASHGGFRSGSICVASPWRAANLGRSRLSRRPEPAESRLRAELPALQLQTDPLPEHLPRPMGTATRRVPHCCTMARGGIMFRSEE